MTVMTTNAGGDDHNRNDQQLNANTNGVLKMMTMQPPCVPKKVTAGSITQQPRATMTKATILSPSEATTMNPTVSVIK